ncbi:flavo-binding protein, variant [Gaertneriomyces semiglobifer]|nr:flavo-binding protein, variant [Gaertneriomyces semiglobifer]
MRSLLASASKRIVATRSPFSKTYATVSSLQADKYKVVVIGAGAGGLSVASQLARHPLFENKKDILLVDPASTHYYQPLWTFVGGGIKSFDESQRPLSSLIPSQADWLKERVAKIDPTAKKVQLADGQAIGYDYLVVAPGFALDFDSIRGLKDAIQRTKIASNYDKDLVTKTAEYLKDFRGGTALFTQPGSPIKCAGAPQKIAYLAEEIFRNNGVRDKTKIGFYTGMGKIFAIDKYARALTEVAKSRGIDVNLGRELVEVKGETSEAVFRAADGKEEAVKYDFLHVTPRMKPPTWIKESNIANPDGYVNVSKETTQHVEYPEIFALGDASSMPTSKTAAAAAAQSGVTVQNIVSAIEGKPVEAAYQGYTSCPLVTGKGKLILAEFSGYTGQPLETLPYDQAEESAVAYYLTSDVIPYIYWEWMLKGKWSGPAQFRKVLNPTARGD